MVSPELAQKIAIEQFEVLLRLRRVRLRLIPLGLGVLAALLFFLTSAILHEITGPNYGFSPRPFRYGGIYYAFTESFIFVPVGFILGFAIGFFIVRFARLMILALARNAYKKMGPSRTVSWNSESITFQCPDYEIKVRWRMIDRIEVASLGVYGLCDRKAFFAIPREVFPPNATIEDLTTAWQNSRSQPLTTA